MNTFRYLYDEIELMKEGEWSSKYHYSNDNSSYEDLIGLFKENPRSLYEDMMKMFKNGDWSIEDSIERYYGKKNPSEEMKFSYFKQIFERLFISFEKDKFILASRVVFVPSLDSLDLKDTGVCWAYHYEGVWEMLEYVDRDTLRVDLYAHIDKDNIDWKESLYLNLRYPMEYEVRALDASKIDVIGYEVIEEETDDVLDFVGEGIKFRDFNKIKL